MHRTANLNSFWGFLLVEELIRNGLDYFCISPGSRSTPLTVAVAENRQAKYGIFYDERAASFHGVGYGKATGKPAVLICTSGTAAANYLPAVIEAHQTNTPLLLFTADRPPELRQTGANQTINQTTLYGDYLNWFFDLPVPDNNISPSVVLTTVDQAFYRSLRQPAGPVHINCMFREPLEPSGNGLDQDYIDQVKEWQESSRPYTEYPIQHLSCASEQLAKLANQINNAKNGALVIGRLREEAEKKAVWELAQKLSWPVLADIGSGLRSAKEFPFLIPHFSLLLENNAFVEFLSGRLIIHIGSTLTSKKFFNFIIDREKIKYYKIVNNPYRDDPAHKISIVCEVDIKSFCARLKEQIEDKPETEGSQIADYNKKAQYILRNCADPHEKITEISAAEILSENLLPGQAVFIGNSMPIRDFDLFADFQFLPVPVGSNRGASGIDGSIASASGYASGLNKPLTIVIGDLALLHDLNSLLLVKNSRQPLILVVINNFGGGIFSFLPIAKFDHIFERFFATPHQFKFKLAAAFFNIDYQNPTTNQELREVYQNASKQTRSVLIEINTDRLRNFNLHRQIQSEFKNLK